MSINYDCLWTKPLSYLNIYILFKRYFIMEKQVNAEEWVKPEIEELGSAKDIVASVNQGGGGDELFNLLAPS